MLSIQKHLKMNISNVKKEFKNLEDTADVSLLVTDITCDTCCYVPAPIMPLDTYCILHWLALSRVATCSQSHHQGSPFTGQPKGPDALDGSHGCFPQEGMFYSQSWTHGDHRAVPTPRDDSDADSSSYTEHTATPSTMREWRFTRDV